MKQAISVLLCVVICAVSAWADPRPKGPVTNLPLPRFVSLKASEGNVRRGPSLTHRIDWVFKHRDMPLKIVGEYGHWRRVSDREGATGWVHYSLLSGIRTVIIDEDMLALHVQPDETMPVRAYAEAGVVARLGECREGWCRLSIGRHKGWARVQALWGLDDDLNDAVAADAQPLPRTDG